MSLKMNKSSVILYADDTTATVTSDSLTELQTLACQTVDEVKQWLDTNGLVFGKNVFLQCKSTEDNFFFDKRQD